jgi:DNA-binding response OmpR family regulator
VEIRLNTGMHIIVVEEACLSRNVLVKALAIWGYDCVVAESEESAWAAVNAAPSPRLVLMDWFADFLDVEEFMDRVHAEPALDDVVILGGVPRGAVSGIRRCIRAGADDVVSRPYDLDEVRLRLHTVSKSMGLVPEGPAFPEE